jgi:hypothetical protein
MSPEAIIALGTAIAAVIAAVTSLIAALIGLRNGRQVQEVHSMVNSQKDAAMIREELLIETLQSAGITIPKDASLKKPKHRSGV